MPQPTAVCTCGRGWTGLGQAHCPTCHEHFTTVANFDRHRPGTHGCQDPRTQRDKTGELVFRAQHGPWGITWAQNVDRRQR